MQGAVPPAQCAVSSNKTKQKQKLILFYSFALHCTVCVLVCVSRGKDGGGGRFVQLLEPVHDDAVAGANLVGDQKVLHVGALVALHLNDVTRLCVTEGEGPGEEGGG